MKPKELFECACGNNVKKFAKRCTKCKVILDWSDES